MSPKKLSRKEANIQKVKKLAEAGYNNIEIAGLLKIHRTTVGRYLELAGRDDITREARIRVIQESLAGHFSDLCKVAQTFKESIQMVQPRYIPVLELDVPGKLKISVDKVGSRDILLNISENGTFTDLNLMVENDLCFASLKQHTKESGLWSAFQQWRGYSQQYISNLIGFYNLLRQEAENKCGLKVQENSRQGLTKHFPKTLYSNICTHVFFDHEEFGKGAYGINRLSNNLYALIVGGLTVANAEREDILENCLKTHQSMIEHYWKRENYPGELSGALENYSALKKTEQRVTTELEKLILKRTFHGRCDLCPD